VLLTLCTCPATDAARCLAVSVCQRWNSDNSSASLTFDVLNPAERNKVKKKGAELWVYCALWRGTGRERKLKRCAEGMDVKNMWLQTCWRAEREEFVATDVLKGWTWRICGYRRAEGLDVKNLWLQTCWRAGREEFVATDVLKGWTWRICGYIRNMDRRAEGLDVKNLWLQTEQNPRLTGRCDVSFGESRTCSATPCGVSVPHILTLWRLTLPFG